MHIRSFPGQFALVQPFRAPEDDFGGAEYVEQPGDRLPEGEGEPEPEPAEAEDSGEHIEAEADSTDDVPAEATAEAEGEPEPEPHKPTDWKAKQIKKLRERQAANDAAAAARIAEVEAENKRLRELFGDAAPAEGAEPKVDVEQIRREAIEEATNRVRTETYYQRLNDGAEKLFEAGKAQFAKTWDTRIQDAGEALGQEIRARPDFLEAVIDLPNSPAVYHELAGDLDTMERILNLPPHKMGAELGRLSAKLSTAAPARRVSAAPPPIKPIQERGTERALEDLINDPNASMEEIERRMAAAEEKRYGGRR